ncbi:MAG: SLC13 family permease [Anaerolineae bacterium]
MTGDIALMLAILAISVLLFIVDWLRVDVVALLILLALILTGLVTPAEAFAGFSSPAVVTVWAIFIVSGGLFHTGVANQVGNYLLKIAGAQIRRLTGLLTTNDQATIASNGKRSYPATPAMARMSCTSQSWSSIAGR